MKKISFFAFALAAGLMMGCSDDNSLVEGPSTGSSTTGKGYISLAINLPTQPSARANDKYDDGTPEEYDVKDATLILFADDEINSAYSLNLNFSPEGTSTDNITTTAKITQQINKISSTDIEALVVLNNNGMFTVENADLKVNGAPMKGKSLGELNDAVNDGKSTSIQLVSPGAAARYIKRINVETVFTARFRHSDEPDLLNNESNDERIENPNQDSCIVVSYDPAKQ